MRADPGSLYDAHADRLYAYCWSLVGDQLAAAALGDAFTAAVHRPPRGDGVLWLYSLTRSVCADRGAFGARGGSPYGGTLYADPDPLLRIAASLPADHREVLLLWAGEWLEIPDIARLLGVAPDTAAQLVETARARLERAVLDVLMRGTTEPRLDLITAFEKGRLPRLLANRAPAHAPGWLRDRVIAACEEEAARDLPTVTAPIPLVVIGEGRPAENRRRKGLGGAWSKGLGAAAGVAASAAAVIGLLASWPSARGTGSSSATVVPSSGEGRTQPASVSPNGTGHDPADSESGPAGVTSPYGDSRRPAGTAGSGAANGGTSGNPSGGTSGGSAKGSPSAPAAKPAPEKSPADEREPESATPSPSAPPSSTPPDETAPPAPPEPTPPDGTTPPSTPPGTGTGTPPPSATPEPSGMPSPTSNPAPNPG